MYHNLQAVVQVKEKRSEAFTIERSVLRGCPLSLPLYDPPSEYLLRRLRNEGENPTLRGDPFAGCLRVKVSAYTDDIIVFVSCRLATKAEKKVVVRYEKKEGAKMNFDKIEGRCLCTWMGGVV